VPSWTLLGQSALSGVFIGALYGLLGLGLTLCWGLLRQINLAHFALVFLGAYLTYQLSAAGVDPLLTLAAIAPAFFVFGVLLHWLLARFKVSPLNTLLVTFGFMVMIESLIQWIWSADFRRLESHYAGIKWKVGALFVPLPELLTLAIAVGIALCIWAILRFSDLGRAMRAAAEDAPIAAAFGVNEKLLALALSGFCAALAAVPGPASRSATRSRRRRSTPGSASCSRGDDRRPRQSARAAGRGIVIGVSEALTMAVTAPAWAPLVSFSLLIGALLLRPEKF